MNRRGLSFLGRIAALLRNAGLQRLLTIARNALDAIFQIIRFPPLAAEIDGVRLHGFLRHRSILEQFAGGSYESATRKLFRELLPSADVFVDAGAHIGLFSTLAGRFGNPGLAVFSFEPDPYNQRAFRWNMTLNRCRNVNLFPGAVSDKNGMARLLVSDGTIGSSLVLGRTKIGGTHFLEVDTLRVGLGAEGYPLKIHPGETGYRRRRNSGAAGDGGHAAQDAADRRHLRSESGGARGRRQETDGSGRRPPRRRFAGFLYLGSGRRVNSGR